MDVLHDSLPLLFNGDGFVISLDVLDAYTVRIVAVVRYLGNGGTSGSHEQFRDLTPEEKRAVVAQVNRRHRGKMVRT